MLCAPDFHSRSCVAGPRRCHPGFLRHVDISEAVLLAHLGAVELVPVLVRIASFAEFHALNLTVVPADQFHRDILLQEGSAEGIPIPAMMRRFRC